MPLITFSADGVDVIEAGDLNNNFEFFQSALVLENKRDAGTSSLVFSINNIFSGDDGTIKFVSPDDLEILSVQGSLATSVQSAGTITNPSSASSTWSVTLLGPLLEPIQLSMKPTLTPSQFPRYNSSESSLQVLLKGSTYTVKFFSPQSQSVDFGSTNRMEFQLLVKCRARRS